MDPLFIAKETFGPWDGKKWDNYYAWAKIPGLTEIVSLDSMLCPDIIQTIEDEDWAHIVNENFRLGYFYHLDYLLARVATVSNRNILGVYRNPGSHIQTMPGSPDFVFIGYDLIEDATGISALTNCGGFPETFANSELNPFGLIPEFARAQEIQRLLPERNPKESHAKCELYAIWRLNESDIAGSKTG